MQTLGLSQSTPASESRMKSLFWPSVTCAEDVDYLGTQGYWVCTLVAVLSFGVGASTKMPVFAFLTFCFFFIGGVGVRERSLYAAIMVFSLYSLDVLTGSVGVVKIIFIAAFQCARYLEGYQLGRKPRAVRDAAATWRYLDRQTE
jgi:hypothetical protein